MFQIQGASCCAILRSIGKGSLPVRDLPGRCSAVRRLGPRHRLPVSVHRPRGPRLLRPCDRRSTAAPPWRPPAATSGASSPPPNRRNRHRPCRHRNRPGDINLASAKASFYYGDFATSNSQFQSATHYPKALASHLHGTDIEPSHDDISMTVNLAQPYLLRRRCHAFPAGQYDFVTTATHELLHGLGFDRLLPPGRRLRSLRRRKLRLRTDGSGSRSFTIASSMSATPVIPLSSLTPATPARPTSPAATSTGAAPMRPSPTADPARDSTPPILSIAAPPFHISTPSPSPTASKPL